jgi:hypothetical protein
VIRDDQRGAVYLEFVIVFLPVFVFFMCLLQLGLLYATRLGVEHAASVAARSAVVVLDDDPARYENQARTSVEWTGDCGDAGAANIVKSLTEFAPVGETGTLGNADGDCRGGPRAGAIRSAAALAMLGFSPPLQGLFGDSDFLGPLGGIAGRIFYALGATGVSFPSEPGGATYRTTWGPEDDVTVRVSYLAWCPIPIASWLMCQRLLSYYTGVDIDIASREDLEDMVRATGHIRSSKPRFDELYDHTASRLPLTLMMLSDARFIVMRADATMPIHGAKYRYRSELQ